MFTLPWGVRLLTAVKFMADASELASYPAQHVEQNMHDKWLIV